MLFAYCIYYIDRKKAYLLVGPRIISLRSLRDMLFNILLKKHIHNVLYQRLSCNDSNPSS